MRANFRTIKFLAATTAMSTAILPMTLLGAGIVAGSTTNAMADPISNSTMIPLQHVRDKDDQDKRITWLGTMVGINDGSPRLYMFDTGSDQFNAQIAHGTTGVKPIEGAEPEAYPYGDGTFANWVQRVKFDSLTYYDPKDTSTPITTIEGKYQAAKVLDIVFTKENPGFNEKRRKHQLAAKPYVVTDEEGNVTEWWADTKIREEIEKDRPGEVPPFYGIFGAGDFLQKTSAPSSAIGGHTKTGYIVSANNTRDTDTGFQVLSTPGCAPCLIMDLDASLRAQFTSFTQWGDVDEEYRKTFPGSGAHASSQLEGAYTPELAAGCRNAPHSEENDVRVLLDTGTPHGGELQVNNKKFNDLYNSGIIKQDNDYYHIEVLTIFTPDGEK